VLYRNPYIGGSIRAYPAAFGEHAPRSITRRVDSGRTLVEVVSDMMTFRKAPSRNSTP